MTDTERRTINTPSDLIVRCTASLIARTTSPTRGYANPCKRPSGDTWESPSFMANGNESGSATTTFAREKH